VFHFAAKSLVGESVEKPGLYWSHNLGGTLTLLDAMRQAGVGRIVFSSTAATYGDPSADGTAARPIVETDPTRPTNPYGASKLAVDTALTTFAGLYGLAAVSLRYFNVAGALRRPDGSMIGERHDPETHLIPIALQVALGRREKLQLFGDDYDTPDGTNIRDYIHVGDLGAAHLLALGTMDGPGHRVYNLGNGTGFSNRQVVEVVREVTGHPIPVEMAPRRPGDPAQLVAASDKAKSELAWTPRHAGLATMVQDAWDFIRS
jgi:UDP-glucose 4-epimerase